MLRQCTLPGALGAPKLSVATAGSWESSIPFFPAPGSICFPAGHAYPGPTSPLAQIFPTFKAYFCHLLCEALQVHQHNLETKSVGIHRPSWVMPCLALSTKVFHLCWSSLRE